MPVAAGGPPAKYAGTHRGDSPFGRGGRVSDQQGLSSQLDFLVGGGTLGDLMRAHDWSRSPLGPPEGWPQSLKTTVGLMLKAEAQIVLFWGPEFCALYNDAYAPTIGAKHPAALGRPAVEHWTELWSDLRPLLQGVRDTGRTFFAKDRAFYIERHGYGETVYFDVSYSAVPEVDGSVGGVLCIVSETTERVLAERRQAFRLALEERLRDLTEPRVVMAAVVELLGRHLGANRVGYGEIQEDNETVVLHSCYADGIEPLSGAYSLLQFGPEAVAAQRRGETQWSDDVAADPRHDQAVWAAIDTRSYVSVPLVRDGRFTASLYVNFREPHAWTADEIGLIEEIAARTWAVVERAVAETALRASEERFRQFGDAAADTLWIVDAATGQLEYLSPAYERIWGEPRAQVMADIGRWAMFVHPEDLAGASQGLPRLMAGERLTQEYRIVRSDGEMRWILDVGFPIRDGQGRVVRAGGIAQDLTERKLAEEALRVSEQQLRDLNETLERRVAERTAALTESQRRFQGIFDSALQFMALLTPDGIVVEVNRTALAWSQITPAEIVGHPFWVAAPMRGNAALQAAIRAGIERAASGETVREQHEMRGAGEVRAMVDFSLKPILDEQGRPVFLVAEGRDITELKEAQEALRQSQKMEAMGQLTGGVAHDFNNLLTPILGALDMLQRSGAGSDREQRLIAGAIQSAERARVLVQRLLAFARRQPLQPDAVDLGELLSDMADLVASTTGPQIKVVVDVQPGLPPARGDRNQLEMAILNLAVNARDAMPSGGTLRIAASAETVGPHHRSRLETGRYLRIVVGDTGIGMDEATLARAVEPFFSTKGVGKGTGLGLSMVHGLATQLGGALTISSQPGKGTEIDLWLPETQASAGTAEPAAAEPDIRHEGVALVVDDEDLVRLSTASVLAELGYDPVEAGSAEEALRLIAEGLRPDIVVTDHLMPAMTGTQLARRLAVSHPALKVLIMSGYAEMDGIAAELPRLAKPFRSEELAACLSRLFNRR